MSSNGSHTTGDYDELDESTMVRLINVIKLLSCGAMQQSLGRSFYALSTLSPQVHLHPTVCII